MSPPFPPTKKMHLCAEHHRIKHFGEKKMWTRKKTLKEHSKP